MKKKDFDSPAVEVIRVKGEDVICTSGYETENLNEEQFNWDN